MLPPTRSSEGFRLLSLGQLAEAEAEFQSALQLDPKDVKCLLGLARTQLATGAHDPALKTLEQLFAVKPDHLEAKSLRGLLLTFKGDPRGVKDLEDAAKDRRSGAQEHMNLGAYLAEKDDARAQKEFELALRVDNRNARAFVELGKIAERRGDMRAALVQYQKAAEFASATDATPFIMRAKAHAALGENAHAASSALEAVTRAPPHQKAALVADAYKVCIDTREFDTAVRIALAALELDAQDAQYQTWMAQASMGARAAGSPQRPKDKRDIFDEDEISTVSVKKSAASAAAGGSKVDPKKLHPTAALEMAEKVLFKDPPQPDLAIEILETSIKQVPEDLRTHVTLGLAYALKGDYAKALPHAQKAASGSDTMLKQEGEALVKACERKLKK